MIFFYYLTRKSRYSYPFAPSLPKHQNPLSYRDNGRSLMVINIVIKLLVTQQRVKKTIPYSIHIEKNNQEQYFDYPKNLKSHNINRKQIGFMKSTDCL